MPLVYKEVDEDNDKKLDLDWQEQLVITVGSPDDIFFCMKMLVVVDANCQVELFWDSSNLRRQLYFT